MLHILLSFILTRTPLARKAILTLASKGLLHFEFAKVAVGTAGLQQTTLMLPWRNPPKLLLSSHISTGGLCGEAIRPAVNSSPHSLRGQMDEVTLWVAPQPSCMAL